jgi:hypothetical protein
MVGIFGDKISRRLGCGIALFEAHRTGVRLERWVYNAMFELSSTMMQCHANMQFNSI